MVNEVKNPVKSIRNNGFAAVTLVAVLYILANVAFFAAIPKEEIIAGKEIAAGLLFTNVFGNHGAVRGLNFLIALSSFGNLIAVLLGQSRVIRECGRQGKLFEGPSVINITLIMDAFCQVCYLGHHFGHLRSHLEHRLVHILSSGR